MRFEIFIGIDDDGDKNDGDDDDDDDDEVLVRVLDDDRFYNLLHRSR